MKTKKCKRFNTKKTYKIDRKKLDKERKNLKYFYGTSLIKTLYEEFYSRTKHQHKSIPTEFKKFKYFFEIKKNKKYGAHYLVDCNDKKHTLLDIDDLAKGKDFFDIGSFSINLNQTCICYTAESVGNRNFTLYYRNIFEKKPIKIISDVYFSCIWSADHPNILYYIKPDKDLRPYKVFEYDIDTKKHKMIYHEKDSKYQLGLDKTSNHDKFYISSGSRMNSDVIIVSDCGILQPFKRKKHFFYSLDYRNDTWYVLERNNDKCSIKTSRDLIKFKNLSELNKYNIIGFMLKQNHLIFSTREKGYLYLYIYNLCNKKIKRIQFTKHRCNFEIPFMYNYNFNNDFLYVKYNSYTSPRTLVKLDLNTYEGKVIEKDSFRGYKENNYHEKIVYVNKDLAISILYKNEIKKPSKCLLYGYGSYGTVLESDFSKYIPSLLDRGFIYCFAHVRGSEFNGYSWYKDGKLLNKKNTFHDFIDCAKYLIDKKYTESSKLAIWGRSAGGLLIGSVINMKPELFHLAILGVPFLDVVDTMHNPCQPLTTEEYEEWGNPKNKKIDAYQRSYSPIDNINLSNNYPNTYIYSNVEDSLVPYKGVLNYYDKLKQAKVFKNNEKELLLNIVNKYGHNQSSDRYEEMKERAKLFSVLLHFIK
tara:strand:- start:5441 stop:7369 length:1929 start_codon:yes stop_codon:yes gene_type:complete